MRAWLLSISVLVVACGSSSDPVDTRCRFRTDADAPTPAAISTPRWAFRPWISKDISTGADTYAFVAGFRERDIPVGAVVLDSPWETNYNDFIPDPARYPNFGQMVADLHAQHIAIVLWTTSLVNRGSFDLEDGGNSYAGPASNFQPGLDCGFYVNEGTTYSWWKGLGAGVDFANPDAVAWWHRQQDPVLDLGIDGWKLDFGEQYITDLPMQTHGGEMSLQDYSEAYYRDFYAYGRAQRGADFVTMVRPYDTSYGFPGRFYARPEHAPVTWVGDNRRDDVGLVDALDEMFRSAKAGYVMVGSDVGGYLDLDDTNFNTHIPFDTEVFARWTAVGALTPFMQLHGRANITPWSVPDHVVETVEMYRYWATLHDQLVPFLYSLAGQAHAGGPALMRPIGDGPDAWKHDWRWQLGDAFLVAPLLDASGARDVALPAGAVWYDWWTPAAAPSPGGTMVHAAPPERRHLALYVRDGAIVPMEVGNDATGLGSADSQGALTVLVWPSAVETSFTLRDTDEQDTAIRTRRGDLVPGAELSLSRMPRPVIARLRLDAAPTTVTRGGTALDAVADRGSVLASRGDAWFYDKAEHQLWVRLTAGAGAAMIAAH